MMSCIIKFIPKFAVNISLIKQAPILATRCPLQNNSIYLTFSRLYGPVGPDQFKGVPHAGFISALVGYSLKHVFGPYT